MAVLTADGAATDQPQSHGGKVVQLGEWREADTGQLPEHDDSTPFSVLISHYYPDDNANGLTLCVDLFRDGSLLKKPALVLVDDQPRDAIEVQAAARTLEQFVRIHPKANKNQTQDLVPGPRRRRKSHGKLERAAVVELSVTLAVLRAACISTAAEPQPDNDSKITKDDTLAASLAPHGGHTQSPSQHNSPPRLLGRLQPGYPIVRTIRRSVAPGTPASLNAPRRTAALALRPRQRRPSAWQRPNTPARPRCPRAEAERQSHHNADSDADSDTAAVIANPASIRRISRKAKRGGDRGGGVDMSSLHDRGAGADVSSLHDRGAGADVSSLHDRGAGGDVSSLHDADTQEYSAPMHSDLAPSPEDSPVLASEANTDVGGVGQLEMQAWPDLGHAVQSQSSIGSADFSVSQTQDTDMMSDNGAPAVAAPTRIAVTPWSNPIEAFIAQLPCSADKRNYEQPYCGMHWGVRPLQGKALKPYGITVANQYSKHGPFSWPSAPVLAQHPRLPTRRLDELDLLLGICSPQGVLTGTQTAEMYLEHDSRSNAIVASIPAAIQRHLERQSGGRRSEMGTRSSARLRRQDYQPAEDLRADIRAIEALESKRKTRSGRLSRPPQRLSNAASLSDDDDWELPPAPSSTPTNRYKGRKSLPPKSTSEPGDQELVLTGEPSASKSSRAWQTLNSAGSAVKNRLSHVLSPVAKAISEASSAVSSGMGSAAKKQKFNTNSNAPETETRWSLDEPRHDTVTKQLALSKRPNQGSNAGMSDGNSDEDEELPASLLDEPSPPRPAPRQRASHATSDTPPGQRPIAESVLHLLGPGANPGQSSGTHRRRAKGLSGSGGAGGSSSVQQAVQRAGIRQYVSSTPRLKQGSGVGQTAVIKPGASLLSQPGRR